MLIRLHFENYQKESLFPVGILFVRSGTVDSTPRVHRLPLRLSSPIINLICICRVSCKLVVPFRESSVQYCARVIDTVSCWCRESPLTISFAPLPTRHAISLVKCKMHRWEATESMMWTQHCTLDSRYFTTPIQSLVTEHKEVLYDAFIRHYREPCNQWDALSWRYCSL